jgi:hypothetical protein
MGRIHYAARSIAKTGAIRRRFREGRSYRRAQRDLLEAEINPSARTARSVAGRLFGRLLAPGDNASKV